MTARGIIRHLVAVAVYLGALFALCAAIWMSAAPGTHAANLHLSHQQEVAIIEAYRLGGLRFAAIILQESSACAFLHGKLDPRAFGCGQLHQSTADGVAGTHVSRWMLVHDWDLNLELAAHELKRCTAMFGPFGGITCYKFGIPASQGLTPQFLGNSHYLHTIERRMRELQKLPVSED